MLAYLVYEDSSIYGVGGGRNSSNMILYNGHVYDHMYKHILGELSSSNANNHGR